MTNFCITVRWLDDRYHGLLDRDGPPEWPPSPFRLFQALVAGVAGSGALDGETGKALEWLQGKQPIIIAPRSCRGQVFTRFVPNNDSDEVLDRQNRLTGKTSRPTIILAQPEIHYVWPIDEDCPQERLIEASRLLSCLGWGVDMAYGDGLVLDGWNVGALSGVRWLPRPGTFRDDGMLRVPKEGSMSDLRNAHESSLRRIDHGKPLRTVYKPQVFDQVFYESAERPLGRPYVVFDLRDVGDDFRSFPQREVIHIAGMTRRAAINAMHGYAPDAVEDSAAWVESFVAGHRLNGAESQRRFSYIPLASIGHEQADARIRRVMITAPLGSEIELLNLAEQLDGIQLEQENGGQGPIMWRQRPDSVTRQYLDASEVWASVTPVILPGHDDHKPARTIKLFERAIRQSGIDQPCQFTWSALPNFNHCLTAYKPSERQLGYYRPPYLDSFTAVHVRIAFDHPVAGPICIGAGRHCGLGVFAATPQPTSR